MNDLLQAAIARHVWLTRYRAGPEEIDIEATWSRVARAAASVEPRDHSAWQQKFEAILRGFQFLPAGRILAGAGTDRRVTLFNCFVMGEIEDTLAGILRSLGEAALTLQQGGGIGCDFSTLRPHGRPAAGTGTTASGPVPFIHLWDAMCRTMQAGGNRRGAMMATLHCEHPDIEAFIEAKRQAGALEQCNLSVLVTDAFVRAVREGLDWALRFPVDVGQAAEIVKVIPARRLWKQMVQAAAEASEPGLLFVDTINRENNLHYRERLGATNPCGEVPLPPYGACNLGSINLVSMVREPFTEAASIDFSAIEEISAVAVRLLDNVIDLSGFPLPVQAETARASRRIGLGITGLADALVMLGLRYDDARARHLAGRILKVMRDSACAASIELAREKGAFPQYDRDQHLRGPFIRRLPEHLRTAIARHGIRNSHLLAIAPTGTISLLAGNVSSGIEPVFAPRYRRLVRTGGRYEEFELTDAACRLWQEVHETPQWPPALVCADQVAASDQLAMLAALQPLVDNAMSKTISLSPGKITHYINDIENIFLKAHEVGMKGLTVHAPASIRGSVMADSGSCRPVSTECL